MYIEHFVTASDMQQAASYRQDAQAAVTLGMRCLATMQDMQTNNGLSLAMQTAYGDNLAIIQEILADANLQGFLATLQANEDWQKFLGMYQETTEGI
jgi:hypothetical protein